MSESSTRTSKIPNVDETEAFDPRWALPDDAATVTRPDRDDAEPGGERPVGATELDTIEALANAATPGPWAHGRGYEQEDPGAYVYQAQGCGPVVATGMDPIDPADAAFIASARTAVPALCREVRRLREERGSAISLLSRLTELYALSDSNSRKRERELGAEWERAREEARLWRALARARSNRDIPMLNAGIEIRRRQLAADDAVAALRAAGIDPDAPEGPPSVASPPPPSRLASSSHGALPGWASENSSCWPRTGTRSARP